MEKFSREALSLMRDGDTRNFQCEDAAQLYSAASNANSYGRKIGCRFSCTKDFKNSVITITRLPEGIKR